MTMHPRATAGASASSRPDAAWAGVTRGPCGQRIFPGGHFFLSEESADAVDQYVAGELAEALN
jgi:surfactin synthase thioesterase subunit